MQARVCPILNFFRTTAAILSSNFSGVGNGQPANISVWRSLRSCSPEDCGMSSQPLHFLLRI